MTFKRNTSRHRPRVTAKSDGGAAGRIAGLCTRILLTLSILGSLAIGLLYLRLLEGPILLPGAARMVTERVNQTATDARIEIGSLVLALGNAGEPTGFQFHDVAIFDLYGASLFTIPRVSSSFAVRDLVRGRFNPKDVTVIEPDARLVRLEDGRFRFGFAAREVALPAEADTSGGEGYEEMSMIIASLVGDVAPREDLSRLTEINVVSANLTYEDRQAGRTWITTGANLSIVKDGGGVTATLEINAVEGAPEDLSITLTADRRQATGRTDLVVHVDGVRGPDLSEQAEELAWLALLKAPVTGTASAVLTQEGSVEDFRGALTAGPGSIELGQTPLHFETIDATFREHWSGAADAATTSGPGPSDQIDVERLTIRSEQVSAELSGLVRVVRGDDDELAGLTAQAHFGHLEVALDTVFEEPLAFDAVSLTGRWYAATGEIDVLSAEVTSRNATFDVFGKLRAEPEHWAGQFRVGAKDLSADALKRHWPLALAVDARDWVSASILSGSLDDVLAHIAFGDGDGRLDIDFRFSEVDAIYLDGMSPVRNASGIGFLSLDTLVLNVADGSIAPQRGPAIEITDADIRIAGLSESDPKITVRFDADGPSRSVLRVIDQPPLRLLAGLGLDVDRVRGRTAATLNIGLPLAQTFDYDTFDLSVVADIRDLSMPYRPDPTTRLQVGADRLALNASESNLRTTGPISINGEPVALDWREDYSGLPALRLIEIEGRATPPLLDAFNLAQLPVDGTPEFRLRLAQAGSEQMTFKADADLRDVGISIKPLEWTKPEGLRGSLRLDGTLGPEVTIDRLRLDTRTLTLDGTVRFDEGGNISAASFDRLVLARTADVSAVLERGPDEINEITLNGDSIDLEEPIARAQTLRNTGQKLEPVRIFIDVRRLRLNNDLVIYNAKGEFDRRADGASKAELRGTLGRDTPVTILLQRDPDGVGTIYISGPDAGRALEATKFYRGARGGNLNLVGDIAASGEISGFLNIDQIMVRSQGTLSEVLDSGGLDGVEDEIRTAGILFDTIRAPFRYVNGVIVLDDAIAAGDALAVKASGAVDVNNGTLDLYGVVSPAYGLTGALDNIPLLGTLLSGGQGEGIFAMTFALTVRARNPDFEVNPASLLTPGIFRRIFSGRSSERSEEFLRSIIDQDR
ncbi:MAG: AsmA-like C-terminal region-containing protein [Pseudomonadota bacterium]